ncbi:MAG: hypothetical protein HQL93_04105 [Magnetococcales bacterium]|nr:hypothetical protein [Magnetococcales bacterium]
MPPVTEHSLRPPILTAPAASARRPCGLAVSVHQGNVPDSPFSAIVRGVGVHVGAAHGKLHVSCYRAITVI